MATDEQGIIKMLEQKINEHQDKINSFRQAINALSGSTQAAPTLASTNVVLRKRGRKPGGKNKPKTVVPNVDSATATPIRKRGRKPGGKNKPKESAVITNPSPQMISSTGKETLEGWVLQQLADGVPKTNRTLMEIYNKSMGKNLDMNGFAARLAILKRKGNVVSAKNATDGLSYNGKAEWFDKGKLKEDYAAKIKS